MSMEHWWSDEREKRKYSEKNMSQCLCVHHKSHLAKRGIEYCILFIVLGSGTNTETQ